MFQSGLKERRQISVFFFFLRHFLFDVFVVNSKQKVMSATFYWAVFKQYLIYFGRFLFVMNRQSLSQRAFVSLECVFFLLSHEIINLKTKRMALCVPGILLSVSTRMHWMAFYGVSWNAFLTHAFLTHRFSWSPEDLTHTHTFLQRCCTRRKNSKSRRINWICPWQGAAFPPSGETGIFAEACF